MENKEDNENNLKQISDRLKNTLKEYNNGELDIDNNKLSNLIKEVSKGFDKYIKEDIITISSSRKDTRIKVQDASVYDIYKAVIGIISHTLALFPKNDRNDILLEAINNIDEDDDEGMLFKEVEENNEKEDSES